MAYTTIDDSGLFFNTILYTGDGTTKTISGVGFQPDMVWGKGRNSASDYSAIDAVRGATKSIFPNTGAIENTNATSYLTGFTADGYTVNSASNFNVNTRTQVNWNWKANGAGALNEVGSINSTVSVNTTSGFSIATWTGTNAIATVGHGLGAVPKAVIVKKLSQSDDWFSYHEPLGNTGRMMCPSDNVAVANASGYWNSTTPTSTVFSVYNNGANNALGETFVAYCFAEVKGFSKFSSYTGNGDGGSTLTSGPFVYTGFRPAWLLVKRTDSTGNWMLIDNKRIGYNADNRDFKVDNDDAERDVDQADLLSNGFRVRTTSSDWNTDGGNYIYLAFAESPFVNSSGVPNNAR